MEAPHEPTGGERVVRVATIAGKALAFGLVFTLAAGGGALLHVGLPAPRRLVAKQVNGILASTFRGKIVIQRIGLLRLNRFDGIDAEVLDPHDRTVLVIRGLRMRVSTWTLVRSFVGHGPLLIDIPELVINGAEVVLDEDPTGTLGLSRAFDQRDTTPGGREMKVSLPAITLNHAWAHGHMAAVPVIDADLDAVAAAFSYTSASMHLGLAHVFVRTRGLPRVSPEGTIVADATLGQDSVRDRSVTAHFDGRAGDIPLRADASIQGKRVSATVDVPETSGDAFTVLAPDSLHLRAPLTLHAEVQGELPVLEPKLAARIGDGEITGSAVVTLAEEPSTELKVSASVQAQDIDLSQLAPNAPKSRLGASVQVSAVSVAGGKVSGTFHVASDVGEIDGQLVPAADVSGDLTEASVRGVARIAERGAPTEIRFSLHPRPGEDSPDQLAFAVRSSVPDLNGIARAPGLGKGRLRLVGEGTADLATKTFLANVGVELSGLMVSGMKLDRGVVTASGEGSFSAPHLRASLLASGTQAAGYTFPRVTVSANGTPTSIDATADLLGNDRAPTIHVGAHVTHPGDILVSGTQIRISRHDVVSTMTVGSIRVAGGTVDIRGLRAWGLGDPITASAHIASGAVTVQAKANDIDLACVAALVAREEDVKGHLSFDVDATAARHGVDGRVELNVRDLFDRGIQRGALQVSTTVKGRHVDGKVTARLGDAGSLDVVVSKVVLGGAAFEPRAWQTATGAIDIDGRLDLGKLLAETPSAARPLEAATGVVTFKGTASQAAGGAGDAVLSLDATTAGLSVTAKQAKVKQPDGSLQLGPPPLAIAGVDGTVSLKLSTKTGRAQIKADLHDQHGPMASLDTTATLPLQAILADPGTLTAKIEQMPLTAKLVVPSRALDSIPGFAGKSPVKGDVELTADLKGTARSPNLDVKVKAKKIVARSAVPCATPLEMEASLSYDGTRGKLELKGSNAGSEVLKSEIALNLRSEQALAQGTIPWDMTGDVTFTSFPLEAVAPLIQRRMTGELSGKVKLADLHKAATLDAELDLRALTLDHAAFPNGKLQISTKDGTLKASASLHQSDGSFQTDATGALSWGAELAPRVDLAKGVDVTIKAKNFRADAAMPFVAGTFSELDGRVDTDAKVHIGTGIKDSKVTGAVTLRDGSFELPQLGERFHGLKGRITMSPFGTFKFDDFAADGPSGHLTMSGNAVMSGVALQTAAAQVHIEKGHSIPIALEGVSMGRAYGDVKLTAKMAPDGKRVDVGVDVPMLQIDLPQSTGHTVQPLDPDKTIRIGMQAGGDFVTIPLVAPVKPRPPSDLVIHAAVKLGKEIEVKRDTTVDVTATGAIDVLVTDKAHITGKIIVERGKLELEGKQFIIDHATVSFLNDPSNPMVIATAYWDAPDSTRVYADFSGLVTQGKLKLRSEPALSQDEILSLILFGSADGVFGAQPPPGQQESTGAKAAGVAGSYVTEGLDKAISGVTSVDISTRVDTSEADNPQPQLAVQISRTVSARLGYKLGVPTPGENPDRTELTLDWRFIRNWSVSALVGDQGSTALDILWRMRY